MIVHPNSSFFIFPIRSLPANGSGSVYPGYKKSFFCVFPGRIIVSSHSVLGLCILGVAWGLAGGSEGPDPRNPQAAPTLPSKNALESTTESRLSIKAKEDRKLMSRQ